MILSSTFNELIYFIKTFLRNKFHQNKWDFNLKAQQRTCNRYNKCLTKLCCLATSIDTNNYNHGWFPDAITKVKPT